eukprot:5988610-Prymnesium_polylepis.1
MEPRRGCFCSASIALAAAGAAADGAVAGSTLGTLTIEPRRGCFASAFIAISEAGPSAGAASMTVAIVRSIFFTE